MFVVTAEEMAKIDKRAIEMYGVPGQVLMERAGSNVVAEMEKNIGELKDKTVLVVCGPGNNGGDGYVIARHLFDKGAKVCCAVPGKRDMIKGDAGVMFDKLPDGVELRDARELRFTDIDIAVDAIFGTGYNGRISSDFSNAVSVINKAGTVVAVDVPSGVLGSMGTVAETCVKADYTVTFCCEKIAHRLYPAKEMCGKVIVTDIGIPKEAVLQEQPKMKLFDKGEMDEVLRPLSGADHKGTNGRLFIIGGSTGMAGSVCLASRAAMRSGVGLCYTAVPDSVYPIVAAKLTEAMTVPLESGEKGCIAPAAAEQLEDVLSKADAVAVGCGMSVTDDTCAFMERLLRIVKTPILIDADGLNIIAKHPEYLKECNAPVVVTPHLMEMSRLVNMPVKELEKDKLSIAMDFAKEKGVVVVLKGAATATVDGTFGYINSTGNPGMATGGSGDVLSGIIGALLAGGTEPMKAAGGGVFLHGMAGDMCAGKLSMRGMVASDIIEALAHCVAAGSSGEEFMEFKRTRDLEYTESLN